MFHVKQSLAESLRSYIELIRRYHGTLDLVSTGAVGDLERMVEEALIYADFLERLSPAPRSIVDVGSGVGLPGIPIALRLENSRITLVERRRRRVSFLRIAVSSLGLANANVVDGDVRALRHPCADVVVAQAVGTLAQVYRLSEHLQSERVWLLSRKGESWGEELREVEAAAGSAAIECQEELLSAHGRLVAVLLPGGSVCPPSV